MTDIWSGEIMVSESFHIKDIILASSTTASAPTLSASSLHFLAAVDTARIPLYLAAGPTLDVWTTDEHTEKWFQNILLKDAGTSAKTDDTTQLDQQWWHFARSQSPMGILVQVNGHVPEKCHARITEILFYGTVVTSPRSPPTPPSSSQDVFPESNEHLPKLRVHALPLSSDLLHTSSLPDKSPLTPSISPSSSTVEPQFLPRPIQQHTPTQSPKRKRDIFDEATELRAKARRKGGEGVAAAAARANESQSTFKHRTSLSVDTKTSPFQDFRPASASGILSRPPSRGLSRSPSLSSDTRPTSRKGIQDGMGKRSALSHVETVSIQPEEPTTETRNKEALSRIVLAAMRMHGFQQRKKNKSRSGSVAPGIKPSDQPNEEAVMDDAAKDEEFKVIHHLTYKGAALALRKHMTSKPLHLQPDRLRDVVEKLLAIFCTDPLTQPLPLEDTTNILSTPGGPKHLGMPGSSHSRASPFDLPSGRALAALKQKQQGPLHTGSPVAKNAEAEDYFVGTHVP